MKTTAVSTQAIANATRLSLVKLQSELARGSQELSSGRHADVGLAIGARTGRSVELRGDLSRIATMLDTNGLVASRLDTVQAALTSARGTAEEFFGMLIALRDNPNALEIAGQQAEVNLRGLIGTLNSNLAGQYLFAGINTDEPPLANYFGTPSPARDAVRNSFETHFGFPPNDPAAAALSRADIDDFVATTFGALFDDPSWGTLFSQASDQTIVSRISTNETISSSVSANERGVRDLFMAYTLLADIGQGSALTGGAMQAVLERALDGVGSAIPQFTTIQARLGVVQNRVADASERMAIQRDILTKQVTGLENVDPFETATRVNALMSQIEISYSVTARVRSLSLIRYL
ncbi:flagellar hook-associated family protein [Salinarimonas sp.]|uniref:flagellar hook-associated family protein n=1 Tax=Salinarimonas sp. TaxID=2766526 RepID=UPI00391C09ED